MGKGKMMEASRRSVKEAGGYKEEEGREVQAGTKRELDQKKIYNLALGHHIAQVSVSNFPKEMTASISAELFA